LLGVSTSGYYAWLERKPSKRSVSDSELTDRIKAIHKESRGTYGAPRIHVELVCDKVEVGIKRVARLMREAGIAGVSRRRQTRTTIRDKDVRPAPDLVDRNFSAAKPNQLWVADITHVQTWAGFLYLAVVLDVFSRRVVGWAMRDHMRAELVRDALDMAILRRRPVGVIHHSDQGSQYTSCLFGKRCEAAGIQMSMGSVGDCYDNALCESFFASLECELIDRSVYRSHAEAQSSIFEYIEGFYNPKRRHSAISYLSPVAFEDAYERATSPHAENAA
jgi:putative transposase